MPKNEILKLTNSLLYLEHVASFNLNYTFLGIVGIIALIKLSKAGQLAISLISLQLLCTIIIVDGGGTSKIFYSLMLLNGPLLYFFCLLNNTKQIVLKTKILHLLPFVCSFLIYHNTDNDFPTAPLSFAIAMGGFSQILYALIIGSKLGERYFGESTISFRIRQVSYILFYNGVISILIWLNDIHISIDSGFNINHLYYFTFVLSTILMIKELTLIPKQTAINAKPGLDIPQNFLFTAHKPYQNSSLDPESIKIIGDNIHLFLVREKVFLQSNITLDQFSLKIQISKNHLSEVFNTYMGNGFYHVVAEYRIQYALDILKNNKSLKIEALAYDCGFNSLSSFNKYFKEIVGMRPSEYVKTH